MYSSAIRIGDLRGKLWLARPKCNLDHITESDAVDAQSALKHAHSLPRELKFRCWFAGSSWIRNKANDGIGNKANNGPHQSAAGCDEFGILRKVEVLDD